MQRAYVFFFFFFAEGSKWNDVGFHFGRMGLLFILHFSISNNEDHYSGHLVIKIVDLIENKKKQLKKEKKYDMFRF